MHGLRSREAGLGQQRELQKIIEEFWRVVADGSPRIRGCYEESLVVAASPEELMNHDDPLELTE